VNEYVLRASVAPSDETARLALIQNYQDPLTVEVLRALPVTAGWRCLDVGAGAGSIARWLAAEVGPTGSVLATDLDVTRLSPGPNLSVRRHDVRTDPLPEAEFDLVHARLVLQHLPERVAVLGRLGAAVRPNGHIVIGDIDFTVVRPAEPDPAFDRVKAAFDAAVRDAGWQPELGARLLSMIDNAGLVDARASCHQHVQSGGEAAPAILAMTYQRLRPRLLTFGAAEADLAQVLTRLVDPVFRWHGPALWTVAARRP
jgi:ubiquinone/menaquinone biosynthesis C-methylase UbiE